MIKYANTKEEADRIAEEMKKAEPKYANDVQIAPTVKESFGIFKAVERGNFVVYNETE